ncbi:MAG: hypothetical protein LBV34_18920 [Nocardiopsaceae bacterium]|nr:hypothetical protein [Nocardiopsaceae bacterium]
MDAAELKKAAARAIGKVAERRGRSRWFMSSGELTWVFELDRGAAWSRWTPMLGCDVRAWRDDEGVRRVSECATQVEYAQLPLGVPDEALGSRFDDHRSYFTMVFDHTHDLVDDDVRIRAFEYCAEDMRDLATRLSTLAALREAVQEGTFSSGFVDRRLK